jgi:hypothetical protein
VEDFEWFVGIDWGNVQHQACIVDARGNQVAQRSFPHGGKGLAELVAWLRQRIPDINRSAVAIEVPHGPVVDTLLDAGFRVFSINPKQLDRFRDRHTVAGAKDDSRDAYVLGDSVRTDMKLFRALEPSDPAIVRLRELSRLHDSLSSDFYRKANQLREQLVRYFPALLKASPAADDPWLWALLKLAPTPQRAQKLTSQRLAKLLEAHRIRRLTGDGLRTILAEPPVINAPGVVDAAVEHVLLLLPLLQQALEQLRECDRRLGKLINELAADQQGHRDVSVLLSLPGLGKTLTAAVLTEAERPLSNRDYHMCRGLAGVVPTTQSSGKRSKQRAPVIMRHACNHRLRRACHLWAEQAVRLDPPTREHYSALRGRGHSHARALRSVADRLLRITFAMLRDQTTYVCGLHRKASCTT